MSGTIGILNIGAGDTKLSFDKSNPAECIRAARIVKDMIRRGYALLIEVGKDEEGKAKYQRALDFDEQHCEYIIADLDPVAAEKADQQEAHNHVAGSAGKEEAEEGAAATGTAAEPVGARRRGRPPGKRRVPADKTTGVAVARTAGG